MTDAVWSPRLKRNIGYVWVPVALADLGTELDVETPDGTVRGRTAALPFVDPRKEVPRGRSGSRRDRGREARDMAKDKLDRRPPATVGPVRGLRKALVLVEREAKVAIWDCRMCGQCILHSTGLTCPMRCPKSLRNGPCGGVLQNGNCEVLPESPCVWVQAWEGSRRLPIWRDHLQHVQKPVDWRLQETSSWENLLSGRAAYAPLGWAAFEAEERTR